ncbi:flagellin lysine-N-methylase [Clostridium omnivorum]|uniref:Flagellar biosynthesis protein n=1 Tax=Clostridium omnivorum TaxID=1604902 RepID=A0ABQ5N4Y4_9CLOT|nr:flagellin lysine-N-methylase [Clostridium sp. E14]GLC30297.1 flagellar biosynthesis protein [Clostridium sp. E14]
MFKFDAFTEQNFSEFTCIGKDCEATCCAGWTIFVDRKTYNKYKKIKQPSLSNLISYNVRKVTEDYNDNKYATIKMNSFGSCPFLRGGLCIVHKKLGESYLSKTCNRYPRKVNLVLGELEASLSLSCPEAARNVILQSEKMKFVKTTITSPVDYGIDKIIMPSSKIHQELFYSIRGTMIDIIQNRSYRLEERLVLLGRVVNKIQVRINKNCSLDMDAIVAKCTEDFTDEIEHNSLKNSDFTLQLELLQKVLGLLDLEHMVAEKFNNIIDNYMTALGISSIMELKSSSQKLKEAYFNYYEDFIKENEHIFENYLVYYVFCNATALSKSNSILEIYSMMIVNYSLIQTILIGISSFNKGLSQGNVIEVVYSFSRITDHNKHYSKEIYNMIKYNKIDKLSYLEVLIYRMNFSEMIHEEYA